MKKKIAGAQSINEAPAALASATDGGRTILENHVVIKIAGLAACEIEGVHGLVPFEPGPSDERPARITGVDTGVRVETTETEAVVSVGVIADYGISIPDVSDAIRRNVAERVHSMTGLKVVQVNIDVVDLLFMEEEEDIEEDVPQSVFRKR